MLFPDFISYPTSYYTSNIAGGVSRFSLIYLKKTLVFAEFDEIT